MQAVKLKYLENAATLEPSGATGNALMLHAAIPLATTLVLQPMERYAVPTGIAIELPNEFEALVHSASNSILTVLNSPGTIDPDYRGEIFALIINLSGAPAKVQRGDHIAVLRLHQFSRVVFKEARNLEGSERSSKGLGSTGLR